MSRNTQQAKVNYLTNGTTLKSWLLTKDHKRIAIMYLITVSMFFLMGGMYAATIRLELLTPGERSAEYRNVQQGIYPARNPDDLFLPYPVDPGGSGKFSAADHDRGQGPCAAADQSHQSLHLLDRRARLALWALMQGGVDTGWTFYTPYSTTFSNTYVMAVGLGIFINGFSSILTGLNFIVTIHTMRAPGMTWFRLAACSFGHITRPAS